MNENENILNNSDSESGYLGWFLAQHRKPLDYTPVPGDWAYGITDPFMTEVPC